MGQSVGIVERREPRPGVIRFEIDRSLTGTGHESYAAAPHSESPRPPDVLATRLFASGHVDAVHVFSNVITVGLRPDVPSSVSDELCDVIENLFIHYRPGVMPTAV